MVAAQVWNARQQFIDINGDPLVGGSVGMFVPGTLIAKSTWQNAAQTALNTNPIILDSRGQATIYGFGTYRQILTDNLGNVIWDLLTYAGPSGSGGATNTITVLQSPYTLQTTDSVLLCDVSGGPITINLLAATEYGSELTVKVKGSSTNPVTVIPNGSDVIDIGTPDLILAFSNQAETLVSDLVSYWATI